MTRVLWRGTGVYILGVRGRVSGFGGGRVTGVGGVAGDEDVLGGGALVFGGRVNGGRKILKPSRLRAWVVSAMVLVT